MRLFLYDANTGYNLEFKSKKYQVAVTSEFVDELGTLGIRYKIAKK